MSLATSVHQDHAFQFDPLCVPQLQGEHRVLLRVYGEIRALARQANWPAVDAQLVAFKALLTQHLVSESVRLYVQLGKALAGDPERSLTMRRFSLEMHRIGKDVVQFLDDNARLAGRPDAQATFLSGWDAIGATLGERIRREEAILYPMYQAQAPASLDR